MPDCPNNLAYAVMYEINKLCYRILEADVTRTRNQLKSSLLLHSDRTSPVVEDIGRQLLTYSRKIPFAKLFARIDVVHANTIKCVANTQYRRMSHYSFQLEPHHLPCVLNSFLAALTSQELITCSISKLNNP